MLFRILHTQTQLHQAELTSILMFRTVHHCIVNDKFGYKYRKQSTDRLHFRPIPRHTLDRTICLLHRFQLHFFLDFSVFLFWWTRHIFVIRKGCYHLPGVTLWPCLFLIHFFSTPTPQFCFKTWSTDSLNISLSTLFPDVMTDGKRLRNRCLLSEYIPLTRKPEKRFHAFNLLTNLYNKERKTVLGKLSIHLDSRCQVPNMSFQLTLAGLKTATSNGWYKWVALGGKHMNNMSQAMHSWITDVEKWQPRLSLINTIDHLKCSIDGKNCLKNHTSKVHKSNHPFLVQS